MYNSDVSYSDADAKFWAHRTQTSRQYIRRKNYEKVNLYPVVSNRMLGNRSALDSWYPLLGTTGLEPCT